MYNIFYRKRKRENDKQRWFVYTIRLLLKINMYIERLNDSLNMSTKKFFLNNAVILQ